MNHWEREIRELHAFFEGWLGGTLDRSAKTFRRLEEALADDFTFVTPNAETLERNAVVATVKAAHDSRPGLRIEIREPRILHERRDAVVAVYQEWQEADDEQPTGRLSTVVFRKGDGSSDKREWLHVHETWIDR